MCKFWLKNVIYGCILGLMGRKIWARTHEESKISLRPVFQPDCAGKLMDPAYSYQDITTLDGYGYARRPINGGSGAKYNNVTIITARR